MKRVLLTTIQMNLNGNEEDEQEISRSCRSMRGSIHGSISNCSESRIQIIKPLPESLYQLRAAGYH